MTAPAVAIERRDFGSLRLRGRIWWLRYRVDGKEHWESSRSTSEREAAKLLAQRQAELGLGVFTAPDVKRTTLEDLVRGIQDDYAVNGRRSSDRLEHSLKHLRAFFGNARAATITADRLTAYLRARLGAGAAPATARNELNALRRAFRLAKRAGRVAQVPEFPELTIHNTRTGFFEEADVRALLAELPAPLQPVIEFAYLTGWRIPSEVLSLTWAQVDFGAGVVRLEVGSTKNRAGRVLPFGVLPALKTLLERQRAHTTNVERRRGALVPWVFHREGQRIRDFYDAWARAGRRAAVQTSANGLEAVVRPELLERIPHDLRRSAVRNMVRAGVPERIAMALSGHKTRSVFDRYNIVSERDLSEGLEKLAAVHARRGTVGGQSAIGGA